MDAEEEAYLDALAHELIGAYASHVAILRLARKPAHVVKNQVAGLQRRLQQLETQAGEELLRVMRGCGIRLNDKEFQLLFAHYQPATRRINYKDFTSRCEDVQKVRRKALERMLAPFDARNDGTIAIEDIRGGDTGHTPEKGASVSARGRADVILIHVTEHLDKADEVRRRLAEVKRDSSIVADVLGREEDSVASSGSRMPATSQSVASTPRGGGGGGRGVGRVEPLRDMNKMHAVPHHEYLHALSRKRFEKMFTARRVQDEKEMEHCTFRPQINSVDRKGPRGGPVGDRLHSLARAAAERRSDKLPSWERKALEHCTFAPEINRSRRPASASPGQASAGRQDPRVRSDAAARHISRLRSGSSNVDAPQEGASSPAGGGKSGPSVTPPRHSPPRQSGPARHSQERYERRVETRAAPLLVVDVNLGKGKVGRVHVHAGDEPAALAENFCRSYGLRDPETLASLEELLRDQIESLHADAAFQGAPASPPLQQFPSRGGPTYPEAGPSRGPASGLKPEVGPPQGFTGYGLEGGGQLASLAAAETALLQAQAAVRTASGLAWDGPASARPWDGPASVGDRPASGHDWEGPGAGEQGASLWS